MNWKKLFVCSVVCLAGMTCAGSCEPYTGKCFRSFHCFENVPGNDAKLGIR